MRELLSLRRDEAPIIGEVYKYENEYLKCVVDSCSWCENCFFDVESCGKLCDKKDGALPRRHFEQVPENEVENVADVKFRHIEDVANKRPEKGEIFIASVGLVRLVDTAGSKLNDCATCDLTMSECDSSRCLPHSCYRKIKR
jgi:hypothetical protein